MIFNSPNLNLIHIAKVTLAFLKNILKTKFFHTCNSNNIQSYTYFESMEEKGMTFDHDFYVVVGKQCRTENAYVGHQHNIFI